MSLRTFGVAAAGTALSAPSFFTCPPMVAVKLASAA
jgi:hypothetical protein